MPLPPIWVFHSRKLNNRINQIYERALRLVCKDKEAIYDELLQKDNSVRVHHRNLKFLATKIFKVKNDLVPNVMKRFALWTPFTQIILWNSTFTTRKVRTICQRFNSVTNLAPRIRKQVPDAVGCGSSSKNSKKILSSMSQKKCLCRLCKT